MVSHRIGILTGGGDAPGLNAVIRAAVKYGVGDLHWQIIGIEDAFNGLLDDPRRLHPLTPQRCQGLLHRGGTILGTTNRGDPFAFSTNGGPPENRAAELAAACRDEGLEGLIVIGGDGTQMIGWRLMSEHGIRVIGVPKTIDNDLHATDFTFGFWSAVEVATEALDRLHTTAEAHDRVMLLEVMGRTAGWIALYAGLAGGADCIAIPEIPYDADLFCQKIQARRSRGRHFTLFVVAEGASAANETSRSTDETAAETLARSIRTRTDFETRVTVLGHLQRGGSPVPFDRVLATRFGVHAIDLVKEEKWGHMVRLDNGKVTSVPLKEAIGEPRLVDTKHELIQVAQATGIEFGGEP